MGLLIYLMVNQLGYRHKTNKIMDYICTILYCGTIIHVTPPHGYICTNCGAVDSYVPLYKKGLDSIEISKEVNIPLTVRKIYTNNNYNEEVLIIID